MRSSTKDRIRERVFARGTWTAESALHLGGDDTQENNVDMALLRSASGFFIPAGSIAGVGRSFLARAGEATGEETAALRALFGDNYASLIVVWDAPAIRVGSVYVRDNVEIEGSSGTAADTAKFNMEVLPAGTQFAFALELLYYEQPPLGVELEEVEALFRALLEGFERGEVRLGARTRRGLGQGRVDAWTLRRVSMSDRKHVAGWLRRDPEAGESLTLEQLSPPQPDRRLWLEIETDVRLTTSVLIRSGGADPGAPDMVHLTEQRLGEAVPLISGTSLAGVLRHRVRRIAAAFLAGDTDKLANRMFGPLIKGPKVLGHAGRVWVDEAALTGTQYEVQARVAIDRFTGGSLETALFDEAPAWPSRNAAGARLRIRLELRGDAREDALFSALLLQTFKDLWLGDLPIGGESGAGRGIFLGERATLRRTGFPTVSMERTSGAAVRVAGWNNDWEALISQEPVHA